jgi:hypothetical protein
MILLYHDRRLYHDPAVHLVRVEKSLEKTEPAGQQWPTWMLVGRMACNGTLHFAPLYSLHRRTSVRRHAVGPVFQLQPQRLGHRATLPLCFKFKRAIVKHITSFGHLSLFLGNCSQLQAVVLGTTDVLRRTRSKRRMTKYQTHARGARDSGC